MNIKEWVSNGKSIGTCNFCCKPFAMDKRDLNLQQPDRYCSKSCRRGGSKKIEPKEICRRCGKRNVSKSRKAKLIPQTQKLCWECRKTLSKQKTKLERRAQKYGVTAEDVRNLIVAQGFSCAICQDQNRIKGENLAIDHCHATGRVRGMLCRSCNTGIGIMKENQLVVAAAAEYLRNHK